MKTTAEPTVTPVEIESRINSLDVVRGIALFGILLMNITAMGMPHSYDDPSVLGHDTGWNLRFWIMNEILFEGTMRGLFSMLFGAGAILLTTRLEMSGAGIRTADIYYRRTIWLLVFGLAHAWLFLWFGDILYPYAIFAFFLFPLRRCKSRHLIVTAVALLSIATYSHFRDYQEKRDVETAGLEAQAIQAAGLSLTEEQSKALETYEKALQKHTPEEIAESIESEHKGYWSLVKSHASVNRFFQTTFVYEHWVWDILSFMLIGMAFYNLRIFHGDRSYKFYFLFLVIGYSIGGSVNAFEAVQKISSGFNPATMAKASITYDLGRLAMTIGHIGLIMIFIKSGTIPRLQKALAAVGRMALTNYIMHSVIAGFVFLGFGFSLFGKLQRYELYYIVGGIWIVQLILSPIWLRYFKYGPLEWLWRSLTYLKRQDFRIASFEGRSRREEVEAEVKRRKSNEPDFGSADTQPFASRTLTGSS